MKKALPADAFSYFAALGPGRTHQAVAEKFDVNIRTVQRAAKAEGWPARLETVQKEARQVADKALVEDLAEMQMRHRKLLRAMASRAARAMNEFPLTNGMQAIKAAEMVIKLELVLAGESEETASTNVEEIIKREFALLMTTEDEAEPPDTSAPEGSEEAA